MLVLKKFWFCRGDWILGYHSMELDTFLIFLSFLSCWVLGRSAAHGAGHVFHVCRQWSHIVSLAVKGKFGKASKGPKILWKWLIVQLVYTMFISNNLASFRLWWNENLVKHQKLSKYYESDCSLMSYSKVSQKMLPLGNKSLDTLP